MLVNFLVVDFRLESKFRSSNYLQHTSMMLVYRMAGHWLSCPRAGQARGMSRVLV